MCSNNTSLARKIILFTQKSFQDNENYSKSPKSHHNSTEMLRHNENYSELRTNSSCSMVSTSDNKHHSGQNDEEKREVIREAIVHCVRLDNTQFDDFDPSEKWSKCRLMFVNVHNSPLLEFYIPVKCDRPAWGVFCFGIVEARPVRSIEIADHCETAFVLNCSNQHQYLIETATVQEMEEWLDLINAHIGEQFQE